MGDHILFAEDRLAAVIIFITAFIGVVVNGFIAFYINKLSMLRNSFGRLLQLQAIGDTIFSAVWAFYFAPTLFFDISIFQPLPIAARFGQLCLICYDISIYTHLVISFNRFISLYFPTQYSMIFTDRITTVLVAGIVLVSFGFSWFLVINDCVMGFSIPRWMLDYVVSQCVSMSYVYYAEFVRGLVIISIFAFTNTCTFIRMHFHNRRKQIQLQGNNQYETVQQIKRRGVEKAFVQQVTMQGFIYVAELVTYFYIATFFPVVDNTKVNTDPNRWPNFLLTTYAWILVHVLDGIITLIFNRQFRQVVMRPFVRSTSKTQNLSKTPSRLQSDHVML